MKRLKILAHSCRALGLWETFKATLAHCMTYKPEKDRAFDRKFGTDTAHTVEVEQLDISETKTRRAAVYYVSAPVRFVRHMISSLPINFREFDFVDYGSGKGRVLMVASDFPFQSIHGVEISRALCDVAEKNLRIYRSSRQKCSDFHVKCMDARLFPLPERNTVFHFYHPFRVELLEEVLQRITAAFEGSGRQAYVLYSWSAVPTLFDLFDRYGFERLSHNRTANPRYQFAIFSLKSRKPAKQATAANVLASSR